MHSPTYDVVIVGAGPAGTNSAFALAKRGHSVLLLEAAETIGSKLCTGIISTQCADQFRIPRDFIRHEGKAVKLIGPQGDAVAVERALPQALVIDRPRFTRWLLDRASHAGAEIRLGERALDISVTPLSAHITTKRRETINTYSARCVIVASGFRTGITTNLDLHVPRESAYAAQAEISGIDTNATQIFAGGMVPPKAFGWIVPLGHGRAHLGLLGRTQPQDAFSSFLERLQQAGYPATLQERPRTWGVPLKPSRRSYGNRCVLVGDAAGHVKPTTGGGIYYSLIAGQIAAEVISQGIAEADLSSDFLRQYQKRWKSEFGRELRLGRLARLFYEKMTEEDIRNFIRALNHSNILNTDLEFDRHSRVIIKAFRSGLIMSTLRLSASVATRLGSG